MSQPLISPHPICQNALSIALVANGTIEDDSFIAALIKSYDKCVAVDGGLIHCQRMGITPDLIIGDWDSIPSELMTYYPHIPSVRFPVEKDHTDLELAIQAANWPTTEKMGLFGVLGKRADQTLVNLHLLQSLPQKLKIETENETIFSLQGSHRLSCLPGQAISLIPIGEPSSGVTTKGLKWELNNATLNSHFFSVSNVCLGNYFEVSIERGTVLLCLLR